MLTPFETLILLQESILTFDNTNTSYLLENFYYHYPNLKNILHEKGTYDVDFARAINSKMCLMEHCLLNNFNNNVLCGSNIIPANVTYDFYIKQDFIQNYQLKLCISENNVIKDQDLFHHIQKFNVSLDNNNYLVYDCSLQNKFLHKNFRNVLTTDSFLNKLYMNKKIIVHEKNMLTVNNFNKFNNCIKFIKL